MIKQQQMMRDPETAFMSHSSRAAALYKTRAAE
jgi:hypothetical protein